jgi:hypothetical protein
MAMSKDLRVILVKLADRLHNMRTIRHMPPEKQAKKAHETMDIYAPLAGRMGMQWMRDELEDLSFRVLNPDARASIIRRFITLQKETGDVIPKITDDIEAVLEKHGVDADVFGRAKKAVLDLAQDAGESSSASRGCRTSTAFASSPSPRMIATACWARSTSAGARCRGGSRTTSASRSRTATGRSTPRCRAATASGWRCRSAPARCTKWPRPASPRTGPTATACAPRTPLPSIPPAGSKA